MSQPSPRVYCTFVELLDDSGRIAADFVASTALEYMVEQPVSSSIIDYVAAVARDVICTATQRQWGYRLEGLGVEENSRLFAVRVLRTSRVPMIVVLGMLAYFDRARSNIFLITEVHACERLILGTLMIAAKYILKANTDHLTWAATSEIFDVFEAARIEREAFEVMEWNLTVSEADLLRHYERLVPLCSDSRMAPPVTSGDAELTRTK
ncbi:hypothetical protein PENSPDRAFT_691102 [Peniophora sp. CONT]|nr:hypothetical protein PENSPDRAFT_691102 [Peniophora sp. CONT]